MIRWRFTHTGQFVGLDALRAEEQNRGRHRAVGNKMMKVHGLKSPLVSICLALVIAAKRCPRIGRKLPLPWYKLPNPKASDGVSTSLCLIELDQLQ